jgi:hypothetical protein
MPPAEPGIFLFRRNEKSGALSRFSKKIPTLGREQNVMRNYRARENIGD